MQPLQVAQEPCFSALSPSVGSRMKGRHVCQFGVGHASSLGRSVEPTPHLYDSSLVLGLDIDLAAKARADNINHSV